MENGVALEKIGQRLERRYVVKFCLPSSAVSAQAAYVVSVSCRRKVNSRQGMCYQRGISLNGGDPVRGEAALEPYTMLTVHRVEKCGSHECQVTSMLLPNEMQSETLLEIVIVC